MNSNVANPMKVADKPINSYEYQRGFNDGYVKALEYMRTINEVQEMAEMIRSGKDE